MVFRLSGSIGSPRMASRTVAGSMPPSTVSSGLPNWSRRTGLPARVPSVAMPAGTCSIMALPSAWAGRVVGLSSRVSIRLTACTFSFKVREAAGWYSGSEVLSSRSNEPPPKRPAASLQEMVSEWPPPDWVKLPNWARLKL
ncbi:hypothetical protein D3C75_1002160 [compost metagenome]